MDVEADVILQNVAKSSGCNYSFHKEQPKKTEPPTPVVMLFYIIRLQTHTYIASTGRAENVNWLYMNSRNPAI